MSGLEIRLLGPLEVTLAGEPIEDFETDAARAVLAYLACEPGRRFSRPVVAEMMWPDRPPGAALSNLRHVLSVLRHALRGGPTPVEWLSADRTTLSISASPDLWVDMVEFSRLAGTRADEEDVIEAWEQAVALWRGPLLDGLGVRAGAEWEEWIVVTSERLRRHRVTVLRRLAEHHERAGAWSEALGRAQRLVEVDPWDERGHRQVMRLLARTGATARAIAHYEGVVDRMETELGISPAQETTALADQIRSGDLSQAVAEQEISYPSFLGSRSPVAAPLFVGREREIGFLRRRLEAAVEGHGRVAFVAGEAGSGKTMLAAEFTRIAGEVPDLLAARGRCNAYGGVGDPYLPFREILGTLTGDIETRFGAGEIDREQAARLWEVVPHAVRLVCDRGPSLVGVMVNGARLLRRAGEATPGAPWLKSLRARVEVLEARSMSPERMQPALFDEYTSVVEGLARAHPLLLIVDDLQWADVGSIGLLWHLARRLEGIPVLIVGAYRPEEIAADGDEPHPMEPLLEELRLVVSDSTIELGVDRGFIDAYIDSEPNSLDVDFRQRMFAYTGGHPLFTVEMLRGMQERGEIRRDRAGVWVAQETLDWGRLPSRVEAVISRRMSRLPADVRRDLAVAAVQGEEFVAETAAAVREDPALIERLGREAASPGRLVDPGGVARIGGRVAARHRFRHILFQRYLYDHLNEAERIRLHEATGRALEDLYRDVPDPPLVDLANHFDRAGLVEPAIGYLHLAGARAFRMSANEEAIGLLGRAVSRLMELPESPDRDRRELELLVALAAPVMAVRGYGTADAERIGMRVLELVGRLDPSPMCVMGLIGLAQTLFVRGRWLEGAGAARRGLMMAERFDNPSLTVLGCCELGACLTQAGELEEGHRHMQRAAELDDPERDAWLMDVFGAAPAPEALAWDAVNTWFRGCPDQAVALGERAIALARRLDHPFTICHALGVGGACVRNFRGDHREALEWIDELESIATREHFPFWCAPAEIYRGVAVGNMGDPDAGVGLIDHGLAWWGAMGVAGWDAMYMLDEARLEMLQGRTDRALAIVEKASAERGADGHGLVEVMVDVERAVALHMVGDPSAPEALSASIESARGIGARMLELRAATHLAESLAAHRREDRAREVLAPIVGWFTEGFDVPDFVTARRVLERL